MRDTPREPTPAAHPARAERAKPTAYYERQAGKRGYRIVAGVDEVGRGCLFGPVVAAAVILDASQPLRGLNDSKLLDARRREVLAERIRRRALAVSVAAVDAAAVDFFNVLEASRLAMRMAVNGLSVEPDYLLVDALTLDMPIAQTSLIKGDRKSRSIAAASIVAKVERDRWMHLWDKIYPAYNLGSNKGYAAPSHLAALSEHGCTPLHRMSFSPAARAAFISPHAPKQQLNLFK